MIRRLSRVLPHLRQVGGGSMRERVVFLHIPKCGGTSVARAIGAAYGWSAGRRGQIVHLNPAASWRGSRTAELSLFEFREHLLLYEMARPNVRYITGHYPFSETAVREHGRDWEVITVLRHPVDRWFSHYFYNRYKNSSHFSTDITLDAYVDSETGRGQGRTYVRWFSGDLSDDWSGASTDRAIENVDRCALVGLLEHLDVFRNDFRNRFGVTLRIPRLNRNPGPSAAREEAVTEEIMRRVEELCEPDLRVYDHVLERSVHRRS